MTTPDPERTALVVFYKYVVTCSACGEQVNLGQPVHDEPDCGARFVGATLADGGSMYDLKSWDLPWVDLGRINYGRPIDYGPASAARVTPISFDGANKPSVGLLDSHEY